MNLRRCLKQQREKASAKIQAARQGISSKLNCLQKHDENDAAENENIEPEPLLAVANGQVVQATSAHDAGHGGKVDHGDGQHGKGSNETWNRFG